MSKIWRNTLAIAGLNLLMTSYLWALSETPKKFCELYADSPSCQGKIIDCNYCHAGPPVLGSFGESIKKALDGIPGYTKAQQDSYIKQALEAIEDEDSDGDGVSNSEEIAAGTAPGDRQSTPGETDGVDLQYRPELAFSRVKSVYCGVRPSYEEMQSLAKSENKKQVIHKALDECLNSDFWTKEALHRLADNRIRPMKALGLEGTVVLADYNWDYRLFAYVLSGDRDARELLLAQYHIDENGQKVEGTIGRQLTPRAGGAAAPGEPAIVLGTGQPLEVGRRAGMITTQWYLMMNTMFSEIPRTAAAQAYRAYLNLDIAKGEGLAPVAGEPRDVDNKNVKPDACAVCHSTLDPLAYSFSTYNGIQATIGGLFLNTSGAYNGGRTPYESDGVVLGKPVNDLNDWAETAANSDEFKKALTIMFFKQGLGRAPKQSEAGVIDELAAELPAMNFSANKLIHAIVDTLAFGGA